MGVSAFNIAPEAMFQSNNWGSQESRFGTSAPCPP